MSLFFSLILALFLTQPSYCATENIFGPSHRTWAGAATYPLNMIGRLINPIGSSCTASLIGKDLILTAAHCISDESGNLVSGDYTFTLPNNLGTTGILKVWYGQLVRDSHNSTKDWALLKLKVPFGDQYGYFGTSVISDVNDAQNSNLSIAGYGVEFYGGAGLTHQQGCSIQSFDFDALEAHHNCDAAPGDSGAPIFRCDQNNQCSIVAMHVAARQDGKDKALYLESYTEQNANVAVAARSFNSTLAAARAESASIIDQN